MIDCKIEDISCIPIIVTISVFSFSPLPALKRLKMERDIGGSELGRVLVNEFSYHMGRIFVIGVIDEKKAILRAESRREASWQSQSGDCLRTIIIRTGLKSKERNEYGDGK